MWMMGYNDGADQLNLPDALINGRKLRPLIPRPSSTATSTNTNTTPCLSSFNGTDPLSFNHYQGSGTEQSKRELNTQQLVVSSRWNPTPEQLQILEELYRRGTRTPSTDHIQHITAQLRRYGKIEGKNVFYWFQNHKARERQKRRRQLESPNSDEHFQDIQENIERKELGANRTGIEVEQTKNWAPTANSSTFAEKRGSGSSIQRAGGAERRAEKIGWKQIEEGESLMNQRTRSSNSDRNATWQMMQYLSCSSTVLPPTTTTTATNNNNLFINSTTSTTMPTATTVVKRTTMDPKLIKPQDLSRIFMGPHYPTQHDQNLNQTLELFPLRSGDSTVNENGSQKESGITIEAINSSNLSSAPSQFFEFLPLKN